MPIITLIAMNHLLLYLLTVPVAILLPCLIALWAARKINLKEVLIILFSVLAVPVLFCGGIVLLLCL